MPALAPSKIVCVGRNYAAHARELGNEVPKEPLLFLKPPSSLIRSEESIVLPTVSNRVEYEGEIGVVVGQRLRKVSPEVARSAITNLCAHQNGPLGEGCIVNGLVTCPWHGYEYRLADGCAPPPFTEKLATYRVRLRDGVIEVDPRALPPGTKAAIRLPA